jgi:hypothetical protein
MLDLKGVIRVVFLASNPPSFQMQLEVFRIKTFCGEFLEK